MIWTSRKNEDGMTEYVSGPYLLEPWHNGFGVGGKRPRVRGWDVRFQGKYVTSGGVLKETLTGSYTCRLLARAMEIAEEHVVKERKAQRE